MAREKNQPKPPGEAQPPADPSASGSLDTEELVVSAFRANWKLDGLPSGDLAPGDVVELTEEEAAPLVECGVLSPVEEG